MTEAKILLERFTRPLMNQRHVYIEEYCVPVGYSIQEVVHELVKSTVIESLNLANLDLKSNYIEIAKELSKSTSIRCLNLANTDLDNINIIEVLRELGKMPALEELDLSHNDFMGYGWNISKELGKMPNLKILNLRSTSLWNDAVPVVYQLTKLPLLKELDLSGNYISYGIGLAKELEKMHSLVKLKLSGNLFETCGFEVIQGLSKIKSLKDLRLKKCYIENSGSFIASLWKVLDDKRIIEENVIDIFKNNDAWCICCD